MNIDPVCGMEVENEKFSFEYKGKRYYFCSHGCMEKFADSPAEYSWKDIYDLMIIGGGPAGLTAAVYASISKIDTILITNDIGGQAIDSTKIKNYMGFEFITGAELTKKFKDQFLNEHYLAHKIDDVIKIGKHGDEFEIVTKNRENFLSHAVIIATGMKKRKLGIPGEDRLVRKGVSYSSVQDIELFKGLDIVVIGGGNSGVQTADDLSKIGCKVTLVTQGKMIADKKDIDQLKSNKAVKIIEGHDAIEILGEDKVEGVIIQSEESQKKTQLKCEGVFIQVGFLPNTEFCKDIVSLNHDGEIVINPDCSTGTPGLYACGDVTNAYGKRIIIASGEGAKAILSVRKFLLDKRHTVHNDQNK
ncbi:MAG: FAD-dependent oxidoreductase [Bacteroidales bacterium]